MPGWVFCSFVVVTVRCTEGKFRQVRWTKIYTVRGKSTATENWRGAIHQSVESLAVTVRWARLGREGGKEHEIGLKRPGKRGLHHAPYSHFCTYSNLQPKSYQFTTLYIFLEAYCTVLLLLYTGSEALIAHLLQVPGLKCNQPTSRERNLHNKL
jgi:hypothetical protein